MSNTPDQDTPPAKKRAAKKTAIKTVTKAAKTATATKQIAKKTVLKTPPTETAVKKTTAKKAARKSASATTPELPFIPAPSPEISSPPVIVKKKAAKKAPAPATPTGAESPSPAPVSPASSPETPNRPARQESPRFGRVAGGGPTKPPAEPSAPAPTPEPSSTPFPQPTAPPNRESSSHATQGNSQDQEISRSKKRREKRKRRQAETRAAQQQNGQNQGNPQRQQQPQKQRGRQDSRRPDHGRQPNGRQDSRPPRRENHELEDRRQELLDGPKIETNGMFELAPKGFGFIRLPSKNFEQARDDVFVTPEAIRKYHLRHGQWIHGSYQVGPRGPQLAEISLVNDQEPEIAAKLPHFDELKAINPTRRISFETTPARFTTRIVDIMAPVGRGQRGLIVSPPRSGKTTLLLHMAEAIREKYDEAIHLIVVLVDERPEEVTEFRRALPGAEIYASSNDEQARNHTRIAELAIERAKRLVEAGKDVFLIMDSITRLARAYNGNMDHRGRGTASGGLTIGALEVPRRLFAAARNTRGGGSLTIMATALIQTNSRADEAIYMEFKGTGNMELVLDRKIAENYIYPAVDIFKSGTRREELLLADHMLHKIHLIRRGLSGHRPAEAMERLLFFLKKFPNNPQMLLEIKG